MQLLTTNCLFFPGLWPHKPLLRHVDSKKPVMNFPLFFTWPTLTSQAVFSDNFSDRSTKIRAKKQQFLIANISEILAWIELKLHSMFIWFILNTFHYNWTKIKNVEFLGHLTFKGALVVQLYVPLMSLISERYDFGSQHLFTTRARCYWGYKNKDIHFQYLWVHYFSV